ncbi:hypothetical protein NGC18_26000 [Klebsiella pneumoniae]|uniref:hypothetical protein n=1 Tax=Klebsiella pneumoniae TaxID=573 RepID=UPI002DB8B159|nr:hypothetical protein [Klebsiella pneumoniae]MEB7493385.1 hypothetical protein [Klebsiella pneumoniae]HBY2485261.1 hypothetical protein [Klebsiella pneumoniae]
MSKTETNGTEDNDVTGVGTFDQIHTELRKVHNIRTPSGAVVKMDGDDKIWWAYFYTFSLTKRKKWCDFSLQKIADDHDVSTKTVTRNAKLLVEMGVLEVKPKERGRGNIYITISIPELIAMKTSEKVTPKSEEKQGNGNGHEEAAISQAEQAATTATPSTDAPAGTPADQSPDLASESATPAVGQRDSVAFDGDADTADTAGTDGNNAVKQPEIFDDRGVITEAFINSLTGDVAPNRNADGTLQSFRYVYWVARHTQDALDGISTRTKDEYMAEARPWHIPPHLLSTPTTEPEYDEDPKF